MSALCKSGGGGVDVDDDDGYDDGDAVDDNGDSSCIEFLIRDEYDD